MRGLGRVCVSCKLLINMHGMLLRFRLVLPDVVCLYLAMVDSLCNCLSDTQVSAAEGCISEHRL